MARADLFHEMDKHLMEDEAPSEYLDSLQKNGLLGSYPFTMLSSLERIEQSPKHHPEGNVWNHTLLVVDQAALRKDKSSNKRVFMWSALLHDLGKVPTTKVRKGKIIAYDHDRMGAVLAADFLRFFGEDQGFIKKVTAMVRWHMQILYVVKDLPFADIKGMLAEVDLGEIALLCYCDRLGRGDMDRDKAVKEEENLKKFIEICRKAR